MGIRSLRKHLRPYGEMTILGRSSANEKSSRNVRVAIDGPCLAHFIYRKLLALHQHDSSARSTNVNVNVLDATPSYASINVATLAFLDEVEKAGLSIEKIYFDGYLDHWKVSTREQRLAESARELRLYRQRHPDGFRVLNIDELEEVDVRKLLEGNTVDIVQHGVMVPSFLVPSLLEGLRESRYAGVTEMVAGEAEAYCARYLRMQMQTDRGIILSNDSDCLLYDIGDHGAVVFLDDLSFTYQEGSHASQCVTLRAPIFSSGKTAKRLGIPSLLYIAYILEDHPSWKFSRVLQVIRSRLANTKSDIHLTVMNSQFAQRYTIDLESRESSLFNEQSPHHFKTHANVLDPRLAEFILGLAHKDTGDVATYYTVPLFEDPSRPSAWEVGVQERKLAYLILARAYMPQGVYEKTFQEKSQKRNQLDVTKWTISKAEIESNIQRLSQELRTFLDHAHRLLITRKGAKIPGPSYWRAVAITGVHAYGRTGVDDNGERCLTGCSSGERWSWENIHTVARIDAFLYSLRMVKQAIDHANDGSLPGKGGGSEDVLEAVTEMLAGMPGIEVLMPGCKTSRGGEG